MELKAIQDKHIKEVIRMQESVGLKSITDGEYRRSIFFGHFTSKVKGFTEMESEIAFTDGSGEKLTYFSPTITDKLEWVEGIATDEFKYVNSLTSQTAKVTLPAPSSQHYFRWREGISNKAYPDLEVFYADVATVYQKELQALNSVGATYVQLDDVPLPLCCDATHRAKIKTRGYEPQMLINAYIKMTNQALKDRPANMTVGTHMCRGNNEGKWLGAGGYEYIAEKVYNELAVDFFCLEYDSPRAGSFESLKYMPTDKTIVLGLVTSKTGELESRDFLLRRIEEAAKYFPLAQLCLSPQCGFATSTATKKSGNPLTPMAQWKKLELVVKVAEEVWR